MYEILFYSSSSSGAVNQLHCLQAVTVWGAIKKDYIFITDYNIIHRFVLQLFVKLSIY